MKYTHGDKLWRVWSHLFADLEGNNYRVSIH